MQVNDLINLLTFQNFEKIIMLIISFFTLGYAGLVFRDLIDLQSHYESKLEVVFIIISILLVVASIFLFILSIS
jgi:hypothetical protein